MESLYKIYKHGCNLKYMVKIYGLRRVFHSLKRNGMQVRLKNNRIQTWNDWSRKNDFWQYLT